MAKYTFVCLHCRETTEVINSMQVGPPQALTCQCGQPMIRQYKPLRALTFSPFEVLTDWQDENYRRYRARKKGKHAPRFSPGLVKRPGAGIPGQAYHTRKYKDDKSG